MAELFTKWKEALNRTSKAAFGRLATVFGATEIDEYTWEELEALLLQADLGIQTTQEVISTLQKKAAQQGVIRAAELRNLLRSELIQRLDPAPPVDLDHHKPAVVLIVGVNGSGKTTTIAKLGKKFSQQGKKVLLGAADTFRAAAVDQLEIWAERLNLPVISGQPNADPGAVAYDTIQAAISRNMDIVFIDTAGRLHTRYNLMEELKKIKKVIFKKQNKDPDEILMVIDSTTGQNAKNQVKIFNEALRLTGLILSKTDGTAKGGIIITLKYEFGIPIKFITFGEKLDNIELFNPEKFSEKLIG